MSNLFEGHYSWAVSFSGFGRGHSLLTLLGLCYLFFLLLLGDVVGVVVPGPGSQSLARCGLSFAGGGFSCTRRDLLGG